MEQKKNEKDVLIVRDDKTGEIGVIAGLSKDGKPKLSQPKVENKGDFMLFNKHDDMLESFFKNFYRQTKEPYRFGFYRVAANQVEHVIDVLKDLLKDPEANKEMLASHRIDTEQYRKEVQAEQPQPTPEVTPTAGNSQEEPAPAKQETKQEQAKEKQPYKPIDKNSIDWQQLGEKWGVTRDKLGEKGLKSILNYGKSPLIPVSVAMGGVIYELDARISLRMGQDGNVQPVPHFVRKEPNLEQEFMGHTFTDADKEALKKTGNMGRVVDLVDKETGEIIPSYISRDRLTNQIESIGVKDVYITGKIGVTELSKQETDELRAGRGVKKEVELASGKKFTTTLQVNAGYRGVEFVPKQSGQNWMQQNGQKEKPANRPDQADGEKKPKVYNHKWTDDKGNIRAPKTLGGVELTPDQQKEFATGKAILVRDMRRDGKGEPYTAFVKYNHEAGKPHYYKTNPDTAHTQEVAPAAESRTQVAVNTHGNTNEATKHLKEPLKQGQTEPTGQQQNRRNRPKL